MVTAKTQYNLANAQEYFQEHLCVGDCYDEGHRVSGEWLGIGAARLGLSGKVHADDFLRLCENQHPATGETLTQRLNTTRTDADGNAANRRVFYDFTFSPPKSVSLAGFLGEDARILEAHARAVKSALREFEAFASTRIRTGGAQNDRRTGSFAAALFTHETSRALDPHLHTHCIVFNATFDTAENRWKALQNYELLRARKFAENAYYHELARELRGFGYCIRNLPRGDFYVEGIPTELCDRFSKRDAEIDKALAKLLAEKPELAGANLADLRARLATEKRTRKQKDLSRDELRGLWDAQLSQSERELLRGLSKGLTGEAKQHERVTVADAVQWAEEHLFDRNSVVLECQVWQEALGRARGEDFSVAELKGFTERRGYIRDTERPGEVTKRDVLLREWEIVQTAKAGVGDCWPLVANPLPSNPKLDGEQRKALESLLASTNLVTVFRGGAGTGKSFVLHELVEDLRQAGRPVAVLAPQRQQVVDMEKTGFPSPATVASFLANGELPERAVIVVDEAGQLGGRQMLELLRLAKQRSARVILSGDTRQHGAVEASNALLAIERHAGVKPVELHKIRRQDPALAHDFEERTRIKRYRKAVELAAAGKMSESKSVRADGGIELADGRILDTSFREFLPGYAVTSYGSQGKTVDYVLFSDSTIKAATNAQQWYVTISRGRRGVRIFTPDKEQLRENVTRSGHRPLALELAAGFTPRRAVSLWDRLHGYLLRLGRQAADNFCRLKLSRRRHPQFTQAHEHKNTRVLGERSERSRGQNRSLG